MGINNQSIKENLLKKDYDSFSEVLELAKTLSCVQAASSNLKTDQPEDCNAITAGPCFVCGGKHLKANCRIKNPICYKCGSKTHITRVCKNKRSVRTVIDNSPETTSSPGDTTNSVGGIRDVMSINNASQHFQRLFLKLIINEYSVLMQFDTGSCVTIISEETWENISKPTLHASTKCFTSFTGQTVKLLGEVSVRVTLGGITRILNLYVAFGVRHNILGMDWICQLSLQTKSLASLHNLSINQTQPTLLIQNPEKELIEICNEYSEVFTPEENKCSKVPAQLYLKKDTIPVFKKARPIPLALRDKVREELDRLISSGVLEEVDHSEWAAPCVLVRKPNGNIRICADFSTGLNQALEVQRFPLPTHDELFTKIGGGEKFTTLDLTDAYLSIPMEEESKKLLVINTPFGLMRYNRLPFGIAPATAIFQRRMHTMLEGLQGVAFLLDDVIVTGKNDEEHLNTLREVLRRIKDNGFCLNQSKCKFMQDKVNYLGLCVSKDGISTNVDKIQSVLNMPEPKDIKQLETFIGMANFYSRFISKFSDLCAPLNSLRKKGIPWNWTEECSEAVTKIKQALVSAPVLVPFDSTLPIVVAADASSVGIGAAIFHRYSDGRDKPIAFCSKTLTSTERNYSQIEKEALAIIYALKKFRIYLWGSEFLLQTDHRPLLSIFGSSKGIPSVTSCRLQRWALYLTHFTFKIEYVSTTKFAKVDCLSRIPLGEDKTFDEADESYDTVVNLIFSGSMSSLPVTSKEVSEETDKDIVLKEVKNYIVNGWPNSNTDPKLKAYKSKKHELTLHNGCIMWGIRIVIPPTLRSKILGNLHDTHLGMVKMKSLAREYIWWPDIDKSIELLSQSCSLCNTFSPRQPQKKFLVSWPHCKAPWTRIHVDFAGPFLGKTFLLVVDAFSGWAEIIMMSSMTATATIKQLKLLFCRYGIPTTIVSDNGTCFTASDFSDFCKQFEINHLTTPVNHPVSNGQAEKYVGVMKCALKKLHHEVSPKGLEADLNNFLFKYRLTPHVTTGVSPAELFLGRKLRCQLDLVRPKEDEKKSVGTEVSGNQTKDFKPGQLVYWSEVRNGKVSWKAGKVVKRLGTNIWQIEAGGQVFKKHADQLRKRTLSL